MSDLRQPDNDKETSTGTSTPAGTDQRLFAAPPAKSGGVPMAAWITAALAVVAVVGFLIFSGRNQRVVEPDTLQPADTYSVNLPLSNFAMSESTSVSGGKSTYLDGTIHNSGDRTVSGVTVQVIFNNDEGFHPAIRTLQLQLIRTREPYIDTEPVSAAPIKPGEDRQFRLIFEDVPENWNMQMPTVQIIHTKLR